MENKELFDAIDNYDAFSQSKKDVLKILVKTAVDNISYISAKEISVKTKISLTNVFLTLRHLIHGHFVKRIKKSGIYKAYQINQKKLNLITTYNTKKSSSAEE